MFAVTNDADEEFGTTLVDARAISVRVRVRDTDFVLSQQLKPDDLAPLFSDAWTGSQVWNCSIELSEYLGKIFGEVGAVEGKTVVELGAGCGLCGLYMSHLGANVVSTDQQTMVPLLQRNAAANASVVSSDLFEARELLWGTEAAAKELLADTGLCEDGVDIILVSDCLNPIYGEDSYENLAKTIRWLCNTSDVAESSTVVYLAYEHRDGGGEASRDLLDRFFSYLRDAMVVVRVHRIEDIDIFRIVGKGCCAGATKMSTGSSITEGELATKAC
eukprot:g1327.t1